MQLCRRPNRTDTERKQMATVNRRMRDVNKRPSIESQKRLLCSLLTIKSLFSISPLVSMCWRRNSKAMNPVIDCDQILHLRSERLDVPVFKDMCKKCCKAAIILRSQEVTTEIEIQWPFNLTIQTYIYIHTHTCEPPFVTSQGLEILTPSPTAAVPIGKEK